MAFSQMNYSHCFASMPPSTQLTSPVMASLNRSSPTNTMPLACGIQASHNSSGSSSSTSSLPNPSALSGLSPPVGHQPGNISATSTTPNYPHQHFGSLFPQLHSVNTDSMTCGPPNPGASLYPPHPSHYSSAQNPYFPMTPTDPTTAFYHSLSHPSSYPGLKDARPPDSAAVAAAVACRTPSLPQSHYPYEHAWAHAYHYPTNSYSIGLDGSRRKNATRESTATLKAWLQEHIKNPYPTKGEKIMLAIITKMTLTQVSTWFANARRRLKKENKMTWCPKNKTDDDDANNDDDIDSDADREEPAQCKELLDGSPVAPGTDSNHTSSRTSFAVNDLYIEKKESPEKSSQDALMEQSSGSLDVDLSDNSSSDINSGRAKIWRLAPSCESSPFLSPPLHMPRLYSSSQHPIDNSHAAAAMAARMHAMAN